MRTKRYMIEVRENGERYGNPGKVIEVIKRVLRAESIGNFNPIFCTYRGKRELVKSMAGDISDPFRRDGTYLETLYIETSIDATEEA